MATKPRTPSAATGSESALFASIRSLIESARSTIARGVDLVQVHTNFQIGRHIVEFEQEGAAAEAGRVDGNLGQIGLWRFIHKR